MYIKAQSKDVERCQSQHFSQLFSQRYDTCGTSPSVSVWSLTHLKTFSCFLFQAACVEEPWKQLPAQPNKHFHLTLIQFFDPPFIHGDGPQQITKGNFQQTWNILEPNGICCHICHPFPVAENESLRLLPLLSLSSPESLLSVSLGQSEGLISSDDAATDEDPFFGWQILLTYGLIMLNIIHIYIYMHDIAGFGHISYWVYIIIIFSYWLHIQYHSTAAGYMICLWLSMSYNV